MAHLCLFLSPRALENVVACSSNNKAQLCVGNKAGIRNGAVEPNRPTPPLLVGK